MINYGFLINNTVMVVANSVFFFINTIQVVRLWLRRRPIQLPDYLESLHQQTFSSMKPRELLYLWNTGALSTINESAILCTQGSTPKQLIMIVNGTAKIIKDNEDIASVSQGSFIAEMSFMTGKPASATAIACSELQYIAWDHLTLENLNTTNPDLMTKLQVILGKDLSEKLNNIV